MCWHQPFVCLLVPCPDSFGFHCSNRSLFCMAAFSIYTRLFAPLMGWFLMFSASMRWWRLSRRVHCFSCWVSAVDHVLQRRSVLGFRSNEVISANDNQATDGVKCSSNQKRTLKQASSWVVRDLLEKFGDVFVSLPKTRLFIGPTRMIGREHLNFSGVFIWLGIKNVRP